MITISRGKVKEEVKVATFKNQTTEKTKIIPLPKLDKICDKMSKALTDLSFHKKQTVVRRLLKKCDNRWSNGYHPRIYTFICS